MTTVEELSELYKNGKITTEEFEQRKAELIPEPQDKRIILRRFFGFSFLWLGVLAFFLAALVLFDYYMCVKRDISAFCYSAILEIFSYSRALVFIVFELLFFLSALAWFINFLSVGAKKMTLKPSRIGWINLLLVCAFPLCLLYLTVWGFFFQISDDMIFFLFIVPLSTSIYALAWASTWRKRIFRSVK